MSVRSNKEKEMYLLWIYHEETPQRGAAHYNGDSTRQTGKRQAEDIMDELLLHLGRSRIEKNGDNDVVMMRMRIRHTVKPRSRIKEEKKMKKKS